jgi:hypothetical protein
LKIGLNCRINFWYLGDGESVVSVKCFRLDSYRVHPPRRAFPKWYGEPPFSLRFGFFLHPPAAPYPSTTRVMSDGRAENLAGNGVTMQIINAGKG